MIIPSVSKLRSSSLCHHALHNYHIIRIRIFQHTIRSFHIWVVTYFFNLPGISQRVGDVEHHLITVYPLKISGGGRLHTIQHTHLLWFADRLHDSLRFSARLLIVLSLSVTAVSTGGQVNCHSASITGGCKTVLQPASFHLLP